MVETTLDIGFVGDDEARVIVDSNAPDHVQEQAELVSFGHYAARVVNELRPDQARTLIQSLTSLEDSSTADLVTLLESDGPSLDGRPIHVGGPEVTSKANETFSVLARFFDPRRGPRMSFTLKARIDQRATASVLVLFHALLRRRAGDRAYLLRLAGTAGGIGRFAAGGGITRENEFDVALAAADFAWRSKPEDIEHSVHAVALQCPACASTTFELMLWPSETAQLRHCELCGAGVWQRGRRRPRLIKRGVWEAMVALRNELARPPDTRPGAAARRRLDALKQAFVENGWPFSEVVGASVLVSELLGPLGTWKFYAQVVEEQQLLLLYSICPLRVPEERRPEVSHFLTRINYGLSAATFELDFEDGEVRCKTVLQLDSELDASALKRSVRANGLAMETYLPAIESVTAGTPALPALDRHTMG